MKGKNKICNLVIFKVTFGSMGLSGVTPVTEQQVTHGNTCSRYSTAREKKKGHVLKG